MKIAKKTLMSLNEADLLNDSEGGLQVYTNKKVAETEQAIINKSGVEHLSKNFAELRQQLNAQHNDQAIRNNIPPHAHEGHVREKRTKAIIELVLIIIEAFLIYYAMRMIIAPGNETLWWRVIRFAIAILATIMSVVAAGEFFKDYYSAEKKRWQLKYQIVDGDELSVPDSNQKRIKESTIWFVMSIAVNLVIMLFAMIRAQGLERTQNWVESAGFVILSSSIPIIGGMLYAVLDRLSYVINAYRKQAGVIKSEKILQRKLATLPAVVNRELAKSLHLLSRRAYQDILMFEGMLNRKNANNNLPKASRKGIEYLATYQTFVSHIQKEVDASVKSIFDLNTDRIRDNFENLAISALERQSAQLPIQPYQPAPEAPRPPVAPVNPAADVQQPPSQVTLEVPRPPVPPLNGTNTTSRFNSPKIPFDKN